MKSAHLKDWQLRRISDNIYLYCGLNAVPVPRERGGKGVEAGR